MKTRLKPPLFMKRLFISILYIYDCKNCIECKSITCTTPPYYNKEIWCGLQVGDMNQIKIEN